VNVLLTILLLQSSLLLDDDSKEVRFVCILTGLVSFVTKDVTDNDVM
jgi:hypothetical protein